MKKQLKTFLALALGWLFTLPVFASHFQGSELTYTNIGPGIYLVKLQIYRDCSGASAPTSASLKLSSTGCNNGRTMSMTKVAFNIIGNLYCPQMGAPLCNSTGKPNYEMTTFNATVTFSATEQQCPGWYLSWTECCRNNSANVLNASSNSFYTHAYINLGVAGSTISNSSPQFQSVPIPYLPYLTANQTYMISCMAIDPDEDSLVYSLQPALDNFSTQVSYNTYPVAGGIITKPTDPTQTAIIPAADRQYSAAFPLPSYFVDWSQPAPRTAVKSFSLDPNSGSLMLITPSYIPNSPSSSGLNKYVVVVQVDEYRKINGTPVKIGSVRTDMLFTIEENLNNLNPWMSAPVANGQVLNNNDVINLRPGTPLTLTFDSNDSNTTDIIQMESDAATILPGATFTKTSGPNPSGTVSWTPTAANVRGQIYYFRVLLIDNGCPLKGQHVQTLAVRVSNNGGVTGISEAIQNQPYFTAYPNPFAAEITFKVKQTQANQQIIIYNVLGQQIDRLPLNGRMNTEQEVIWKNAGKYPAGQYVARFNNASGQSLKINKLQ